MNGLSKNAFLYFFVIIILSYLITSCKTILQHTVGKTLYKKRYLNGHTKVEEFYYKVPYQLVDGKLLVQINFGTNDNKFTFLFDTGSRSFISKELAGSLGLQPLRYNLRSTDFNNTVVNTNLYQLPKISIGEFDVFNFDVLMMQKDLSINCERKIDGILGSNILDLAVFQFQPESGTLIITSSVSKLANKSLDTSIKTKRKWQGDLVSKELRLGRRRSSVIFDSGYKGLLVLQRDSTDRPLNIESSEVPIKESHYALKAQHSEKIHKVSYYKFEDVHLGTLSLESVVVPVVKGVKNYCLIGSDLYSTAIVTIDARNDRIYTSTPNLLQQNVRISNIRFSWKPERGAYISALDFNGKLEQQGLRVYDSVISINNVEVVQFKDICAFETFLESINMNTREFTFAVAKDRMIQHIKITPELMFE